LFETHADFLHVLPVVERIPFERQETSFIAVLERADLPPREKWFAALSIPSSNVGRPEAGVLLLGAGHCIYREMKGAW
jgi:hypothetical protein